LLPAVDVIAEEQIVRLGREPSVLEQTEQVAVLPVHVPADLQRRLELEQARLPEENLPVKTRREREAGAGGMDATSAREMGGRGRRGTNGRRRARRVADGKNDDDHDTAVREGALF
jgi:hypothetical protein